MSDSALINLEFIHLKTCCQFTEPIRTIPVPTIITFLDHYFNRGAQCFHGVCQWTFLLHTPSCPRNSRPRKTRPLAQSPFRCSQSIRLVASIRHPRSFLEATRLSWYCSTHLPHCIASTKFYNDMVHYLTEGTRSPEGTESPRSEVATFYPQFEAAKRPPRLQRHKVPITPP